MPSDSITSPVVLHGAQLHVLRVRSRYATEPDGLVVRSIALEERPHEPYSLRVSIADAVGLEAEALLGARVELETSSGEQTRRIHGVVLGHDRIGEGEGGVRLNVGPALSLLGLHRRCRVFQGRSVVEIVRSVAEPLLVEQGSALVLDWLTRGYPPRGCCAQYHETDLAFVLRILAEAGITLRFDHGDRAEAVVLVDTHAPEARALRLPVVPPRPRVEGVQTAIVIGLPDEDVHTDRLGWIHVRLPWDDAANDGEHTTCWVRVAMAWAGDARGSVFRPRVGAEVVLSFIDGDPERPLCIGVLDEGPRPSCEGGSTWAVVMGRRSTVVAEDVLAVTGHQQHTVGGDLVQSIKGALRLRVGAAPTVGQSDRSVTLTVEHGIFAVDAAEAVVLRCGSSRIELGREQIVITSPRARVEGSVATGERTSAITLEAGGIDIEADDLRQHVGSAQVSADTAIVLGIGPQASEAALALSARGIMASARGHLDAKADEVCVLGTSSLGLAGKVTGVRGREVAIDADLAIEITSRGPVDVIANDDAATH